MPASPPHEIQLNLAEFDRSKLPPEQRDLEGNAFQRAVQDFVGGEFSSEQGGAAQVVVTEDRIIIRWEDSDEARSFSDRGIDALQRGNYEEGIRYLTESLRRNPTDPNALFNLGMALSDQGRIGEAIENLQRLLLLVPDHSHGWTALGVAHARQGDLALATEALQTAVRYGPNDGYARRTLGAVLAQKGDDPAMAKAHLIQASRLLPEDPGNWLNLGSQHESLGEIELADAAYLKVLDLVPAGSIRESAEKGRSRIAEATFRASGEIRPDAFAYCISAMKTFDGQAKPEVQKITFEIAMLGTKGLDVNDPAEKYSLRSLPGKFSGLHLLCIEYVGFKILDPSVDIGFDLSSEFKQAKAVFDKKGL